MSVTNTSLSKLTFFSIMIQSLLHVMIHILKEQKVDEKHINLTFEPKLEKNDFHVTHIPLILKLEPTEYFYPKLNDATLYNYSKQAIMRTSDYT